MRQGLQDMHQLQELIRLHRLGTTARDTSKQLGIDRKTERRYRRRLADAGLLEGSAEDLPSMSDVKVAIRRDTAPPPQDLSDVLRQLHDPNLQRGTLRASFVAGLE